MIGTLLVISLFGTHVEEYDIEVDSARGAEYIMSVLELRPDTIMVLGKASAFGWDRDSNLVRGNSEMFITFVYDHKDISVETTGNGLFYFYLERSTKEFDCDYLALKGFTVSSAVITTEAMGLPIYAVSGIAFAEGFGKAYYSDSVEDKIPDSMCLWGYRFSDDQTGILSDFCTQYPNHEFAPSAKKLIGEIEMKRIADSLIDAGQCNAARELLVKTYNSSPESEYLILSLVEIHIERAKHFIAQTDTIQALRTLRDCMKLGDNKGLYGGLMELHLLTAVISGYYHPPFDAIGKQCKFSDWIKREMMLDFLDPFSL